MPSGADYYPTREDELIAWHAAFSAAVSSYAGVLGLDAGLVTQIALDASVVSTVLGYNEQAQNFGAEVVGFKNQVLHGELNLPNPPLPTVPGAISLGLGWMANIEARTRQYVAQIKANAAYTNQMGQDMGIFGVTPPAGQVTVTAQALTQSQVAIQVFKAGFGTVVLDSRVAGGAWEQIAFLTDVNYVDARAPLVAGQPEVREYRVQGYEDNARQGALSPVVQVVTVP